MTFDVRALFIVIEFVGLNKKKQTEDSSSVRLLSIGEDDKSMAHYKK